MVWRSRCRNSWKKAPASRWTRGRASISSGRSRTRDARREPARSESRVHERSLESQDLLESLSERAAHLAQGIPERTAVLPADRGGFGAGPEPFLVGDRAVFVGQLTVVGINDPAHHAGWHHPVGCVPSTPAVPIEIGECRCRHVAAGGAVPQRYRRVVTEPEPRYQRRREPHKPDILAIVGGAGLAGDRPADSRPPDLESGAMVHDRTQHGSELKRFARVHDRYP